MSNKMAVSIADALGNVQDGATVMIGGSAESRARAQDHLQLSAPGRQPYL